MKYLPYIVFFFILISCASSNEVINVSDTKIDTKQKSVSNKEKEMTEVVIPIHNVQILIRQHIPYCGGASPSDAQLNNSIPYSGDIVLINHRDSSKTVISSLQNGGYYLNLAPGSYSIQEGYKNVPYNEFRSANYRGYSQYIISGDEECYRNWWKSTLQDFEVTKTEEVLTIHCSISSSCYTGNNPCDYYNGPLPQ